MSLLFDLVSDDNIYMYPIFKEVWWLDKMIVCKLISPSDGNHIDLTMPSGLFMHQ